MFDVWQNVLAEIEQNVSRAAFATWFTDVTLLSIDGGVVIIEAPNVFKAEQLSKRYDENIKTALKNNQVEFSEVEYRIKSSSKVRPRGREITMKEVSSGLGATVSRGRTAAMLQNFSNGLSSDYSLSNFVIGSSNEVAVSVAQTIIKNPGKNRFNPFFLYGGPGLGKTHLVQAIGNEIVRRNPKLKVLYTTTNNFYAEFIKSLRQKKGDSFAKKYRGLDVLIIDDFQAIMKKEASQDEFFNTFNDLYQRKKQVIVTSDRLPEEIKTIDARLASRLAWTGPIDL